MRIVWVADAQADLENTYRFLARESEKSAVKIHNAIYDQTEKLTGSPKMGAVEPLLNGDSDRYRSLVIKIPKVKKTYKVVYRYDDEFIYIIAVWDCRQNPETLAVRVKKK